MQGAQRLFDAVRACLEYENVVGLDLHDTRLSGHAASTPNQANDLDVDFLRVGVEVAYALADDRRTLANAYLRNIVLEIEQFLFHVDGLPLLRQQAPANERHVCDADHCASKTHGRKIEHPVRLAQRITTVLGDDDIGGCTNERDHAPEDGSKRQRHQ